MAEETQPTASEPTPQAKEVVVTEAAPPPEEKAELAETAAAAEAAAPKEEEAEEPKKEAPLAAAEAAAAEEAGEAMPQSVSFKEESNLVSDLADPEKKALDELKQLVAAALANNEFVLPPPPPPPPAPAAAPAAVEDAPPKPSDAPEEPAKDEAPKPPESEEPKTGEEAAPAPAPAPPTPETGEAAAEEAPPPPPPEAAAEEKAVEVVVDDDGAKTVEAIEETVVPVAPAPAPGTEEPAETKTEAPAAAAAAAAETSAEAAAAEEVVIWGVPILGDERSDAVLLKFLRARDFKAKDAAAMLRNAVLWRKRFGIEALLDADLGLPEMDRVVFTRGADREGHPVCYNVYGEFQNRELYEKAFGDEEKRERFLKWRIQYLEKGIRTQLDFSPGGVCSMVQVTDLKNSPRFGKHRQVTRQALTLLQDNYPEFIAKKLFINVPWWYLAVNRMMGPFFTQRTKSKFVFASPSKSAETLFKYIAPEQVPVQFGGLAKENDPDFAASDAVTDITLKPSSKQTIDIPVPENSTLVWEIRVLGWEVSYGAEFVPNAEDGYTVIVQKTRKLAASDEAVVKGAFKTGEAGKVVLIVDNPLSKKKKLLYRSKTKSSTESV